MTGSTQPSLSSQILMTLMQLQQGSSASDSSGSTSTTNGTQGQNPLGQLFSAMDTDGNGSVSQSEMESYLENAGATQGQADSLYSMLDQNGASGSAGITESQMASQLPQGAQGAQGMHGHHHHHHGAGGASQSSQAEDPLMQMLDANNDGSVSQDEFSNFMTANGATSGQASSDFNALDSNGSGSLSSADFAQAWQNLQSAPASASGSLAVSLMNAFANATSFTNATMSIAA